MSSVVRSLVVAIIVIAMLVAASRPSAAHRANAVGPVAYQSGDDGAAEGDDDDGPIDCSIPDNQDDTGCDTGDVQDSEGAVGDSSDFENRDSGGADDIVPRGGVQTGAGGTAR